VIEVTLAHIVVVVSREAGVAPQAQGHRRQSWGNVIEVQEFSATLNLNPTCEGSFPIAIDKPVGSSCKKKVVTLERLTPSEEPPLLSERQRFQRLRASGMSSEQILKQGEAIKRGLEKEGGTKAELPRKPRTPPMNGRMGKAPGETQRSQNLRFLNKLSSTSS
jgi:hypothetical protein